MILLNNKNIIIGKFMGPLESNFTKVYLNFLMNKFSYLPIDIFEHEIPFITLQKVEYDGYVFVRIIEDTPSDLFSYEGFEKWTG